MRTLTKDEFMHEKRRFFDIIRQGALFIYPTDTIYGLSCDATNCSAIKKIRLLKERPDQPLSIHVPSKEWIYENCEVPMHAEKWISRLPGPYTLILKTKKTSRVCPDLNPKSGTIGVRIPDYWTSDFVKELDIPIVTTSVNKSKDNYMTRIGYMDDEIKSHADFIIYEGEKRGKPSAIVDLSDGEKVRER